MIPQRGDVHWIDPGPATGTEQRGRRPYVVVSHGHFHVRTGTVIAMAVTSRPQRAPFPVAMALRTGGLPRPSWVKIHQVQTISLLRLGERIGRVDRGEVDRVVAGLVEILQG